MKITKNENYFKNDNLAEKIWIDKYKYKDENLEQFFIRIASEFARLDNFKNAENIKDLSYLSEYGSSRLNIDRMQQFLNLFKDFNFILPGGSVLAGIGTGLPVSLSNCFVLDTGDSIERIFNTARDMSQIYKRRGGNGTDLSSIRPAKAKVNNAARTTGGIVPFMDLYSQVTNTIGQEGRRGALMLSIDINHPDSPEFITSKQDLSKVTGANISVRLNKEFKSAVENDTDYYLRWPCDVLTDQNWQNQPLEYDTLFEYDSINNGKIYIKKIQAKKLWESIVSCAWASAEPGILFWDTIIDNDPASVYEAYKAVSTNPCVIPTTTLLTKKGFEEIGKLVGKEIEIWNGNEWTLVTPFKTSDNEKIYKITFSDGSDLTCTNYHKFILKDNIRKELKDCIIGDKLEKFTYPCALKINSNYEDASKWYTFGFFSGDGTIAKEDGRSNRYFIDLYGEKIKLLDKLNVSEYGAYDEKNDKIRTILNIEIPFNDKNFVPNKNSYSNEQKINWLAGIIDSDGTLNDSGGSIGITSINKKFLLDIKELLILLGIRSTIGINKEKQNKEIKENNYECKTCYRLIISSFSVRQLINLGLNTYRVPLIANPNRDASRFIQIQSIEYVGESDVYCVTDNKNHSALFNHVMTAQCGEIPLSPYDSCRLLATNLYALVANPFTKNSEFDESLAYEIFYEAQILGDILVDLEVEAAQRIIDITEGSEKELWTKIKEVGFNGRRTGVGITGAADMFAALGLPYGDEILLDRIMNLKQQAELDASIDLAIINGPFPAYSSYLEYDENDTPTNSFFEHIKYEFPDQYSRMLEYGRRNISWSTIAPTGSISMLAGTSSGCEPVFSLYYTRRKKCNPGVKADFIDLNGVGFTEHNVIHGTFKKWYEITYDEVAENLDKLTVEEMDKLIKLSPWYGQTAGDIKALDRVKTQSILQKYTTHSISSTVNVNNDTTVETIEEIYNAAWNSNCKGITVYRDGSRSGILIKSEESKILNNIVNRPDELECKVEQFKNEKKDWLAIVGLIDGIPYEIFTGPKDIDVFPIPSSVTKGVIIKVKQEGEKSRYDFRYEDSYGYTNTLGGLSRVFDKEYWNYGRLVSGLLRSQIPIEQIVKIVDGLTFTNKGMNNWKSGVIRSLKVFIKDGTKVINEKCYDCGSDNVVYEGGCKMCKNCGSSSCG